MEGQIFAYRAARSYVRLDFFGEFFSSSSGSHCLASFCADLLVVVDYVYPLIRGEENRTGAREQASRPSSLDRSLRVSRPSPERTHEDCRGRARLQTDMESALPVRRPHSLLEQSGRICASGREDVRRDGRELVARQASSRLGLHRQTCGLADRLPADGAVEQRFSLAGFGRVTLASASGKRTLTTRSAQLDSCAAG